MIQKNFEMAAYFIFTQAHVGNTKHSLPWNSHKILFFTSYMNTIFQIIPKDNYFSSERAENM